MPGLFLAERKGSDGGAVAGFDAESQRAKSLSEAGDLADPGDVIFVKTAPESMISDWRDAIYRIKANIGRRSRNSAR